MTRPPPMPERLEELLADRALVGLDDAECAELDALLAKHPDVGEAEFELAAAAADLAFAAERPEALRRRDCGRGWWRRLRHSSPLPLWGKRPPTPSDSPLQRGREMQMPAPPKTPPLLIWAVAGGGGGRAIAVTLLLPGHSDDPARHRAKLLAEAKDVKTIAWADPAKGPLTGDVVWSDARQEGYIRFRGLPANDPKREQYQLWIQIDAGRKAALPPWTAASSTCGLGRRRGGHPHPRCDQGPQGRLVRRHRRAARRRRRLRFGAHCRRRQAGLNRPARRALARHSPPCNA